MNVQAKPTTKSGRLRRNRLFAEVGFEAGLAALGPDRFWPPTAHLFPPDYVDRDLHCRNRSSVLKPVCGVPVLRPTYSRPIVGSDSISMVGDRSLQYVDGARSVYVVVNRAEHAARLDGHHAHAKLAPGHALDLRAEVDG